jgi:hypothetical protein
MAQSDRVAEVATLLRYFIARRELGYGKWQTAWELGLGVANELIRGIPRHEQMEVRNKRLGDEVNAADPPYPLRRGPRHPLTGYDIARSEHYDRNDLPNGI